MASDTSFLLIGGIAAVCSYLATFVTRAISVRVGFVAAPDERRVHTKATPYGGGASMFFGFLVAMVVAHSLGPFRAMFQDSSEPLGLVLGAFVILAVGTIDDAREMSAPAKMAGQVLCAMVLYGFGVTMFWFKIPLAGLVVLNGSVTPLLTALWVIGMTNAVNLVDGLDGLATGIVAIGSGALAVYGIRLAHEGAIQTDNLGPLIAVIACGICIGFLPHNFHPARVFMGDAGALFLGLLMAAGTMVIGGRTYDNVTGQTYFFFFPLFIPLFILGVPIADMAFAFIRRTARRTSFHMADKGHIHHRLMNLGHGHRKTVVILWAWTAVLSAFGLSPLFFKAGNAIVPFAAVALVLTLYTLFHPGLLRRDAEEPRGHRADSSQVSSAETTAAPAGIPPAPTPEPAAPPVSVPALATDSVVGNRPAAPADVLGAARLTSSVLSPPTHGPDMRVATFPHREHRSERPASHHRHRRH